MKNIILASTSLWRKKLLQELDICFKVVGSDYKEDMDLKLKPPELAKYISRGKAESVAKRYKKHIIIAADTFIVLKNELLGKPHTISEAKKMLGKISGKSLLVITGFTIIDTTKNKKLSRAIRTKVYIKKLSICEINNYIKKTEPLDKAGAFTIQGFGAVIVKKIEGDYYNVVGLPLNALSEELQKFGVYTL